MRNERFRGGNGGSGGYESRGGFAPVKVGEEIDVTIEAVGEKGDGIAKKNGFVLFVAGTKQGDNVKIRITRVLRKVGFAEVVGQGSGSSGSEAQSDGSGNSEQPAESGGEEPSGDSEDFGEETQQ